MHYSLFFLLLFLIAFSAVAQQGGVIKEFPCVRATIDQFVEQKYEEAKGILRSCKLPNGHPDMIVLEALDVLFNEAQLKDKDIQRFEQLKTEKIVRYVTLGPQGENLGIGALGGNIRWNNLINLVLGRYYYAKARYREAAQNFKEIGPQSPFYYLAQNSLFWTFARLKKIKEARLIVNSISEDKLPLHLLKNEFQLMRAFVLLHDKKHLAAFELADKVMQDQSLSGALRAVAFKIYAEAGFNYWSQNSKKFKFEKSVALLDKVVKGADQLRPQGYCDAECAFFLSEALWNLSAEYRVEDPVRYEKIWTQHLQKADEVLGPFVQRALDGHNALSENAYFLSVAISWDLQNFTAALQRTKALENLYPQGKYREDAFQLLGDYYFEQKQFPKAITYYSNLVKVGDDEKSAYGLYKASWAFYNVGDKWKALRHMERLVSYFGRGATKHSIGIYKESGRDMLLFLAELMDARSAIDEVKFIVKDLKRHPAEVELLASYYKKLGRFREAKQTFEYLLENYTKDINPFDVLSEILDCDFRLGEYLEIEKSLERFFAKLSLDNQLGDFPQKVSHLTLILHREARKTDSKDAYQSIDYLYTFLQKNFGAKLDFDIYYHGAQRFEQRGKVKEAILWYENAALQKHENSLDAAYTVMKLVKDISDQQSLKIEVDVDDLKFIQEQSLWFVAHFPTLEDKHIADYLYMESMLLLKEFEKASQYLVQLFSLQPQEDKNDNKLVGLQSYFYRQSNWSALHQFCLALLKRTEWGQHPKNKERQERIRLLAQESAFQQAYAFERKGNLATLSWYKKSIANNFRTSLSLKAWNNLLLFLIEKKQKLIWENEVPLWITWLEVHESSIKEEDRELVSNILGSISAYYKKSQQLYLAALYWEKKLLWDKSENVKDWWDLALLFARYNDIHFWDIWKKYKDDFYKVSSTKEIFFVLNLLPSGEEFKSSFYRSIQDKEFKTNSFFAFALYDYYLLSNDRSILDELMPKWESRVELLPVFEKFAKPLKEIDDFEFSIEEKKKWEPEELLALLKTLEGHWEKYIEAFKVEGEEWSIHSRVKQLCQIPTERKKMQNALGDILSLSKEQAPQWKEFFNVIEGKITQQQSFYSKESKRCDDQKREFQLLPAQGQVIHCLWERCALEQSQEPWGGDRLFEQGSFLKQVYVLIGQGQMGMAHYLFSSHKRTIAESVFFNAIIRLYWLDPWGASQILKELSNAKLGSEELAFRNFLLQQCANVLKEDFKALELDKTPFI